MARATVELPALLSRVTGEKHVELEATDVGGVITALLDRHPGIRQHLFDDRGALRPNVLCAIDGVPTRLLDRTVALPEGATVVFVPSVAGG